MKRVLILLGVGSAAAVGLAMYLRGDDGCASARERYGLEAFTCPEGKVRQTVTVEATGLRRGDKDGGRVRVWGLAHYTTRRSDDVQTQPIRRFDSVQLALVDAKNVVTPLPVARWEADQTAQVTLPDVPDGDYKLRATYRTKIEAGSVDVPLALYTPGRIHVLTDRPLYEPGNQVKFRAVVLRARDLAPLDGRPGKWRVIDPNGDVMLEEQANAGEWGVVAGSFPLDAQATQGTWKVAWESGGDRDEVPFEVEPFTLPRFRVDATAEQAFYRVGQTPLIRGSVLYSSGAPVANARIEVTWGYEGEWPLPTNWLETVLPTQAVTSAAGRFELKLPTIPADLVGRATLVARIGAIDAAGDRVESAAAVLLSEEGIQVSAVTELAGGLVEGFNNRLFVRATTPDGRVLANTKITVKRAWQPKEPGVEAMLDEDGVATLQIDPGAPVNVVIPALPYRPPPKRAAVSRGEPEELVRDEGASLADQVAMDRWLPALEPCARYFEGDESLQAVTIGVRVTSGGSIVSVAAGSSDLETCLADAVRRQRLPAGGDRMYAIPFNVENPDLPTVDVSANGVTGAPEAVEEGLRSLAKGARDCLPRTATGEGTLPRRLLWSVKAGASVVSFDGWIADPEGTATAALPCLTSRLAGKRITLAEPSDASYMGVAQFSVGLPASEEASRPQATTMLGYELVVTADDPAGPQSAKLRVHPGTVPALRMRVTPILPRIGETVTAQLIRGPEFRGTLPKELELVCLKSKAKQKLESDNTAKFAIAADATGWCEVVGGGVRALVYVKTDADLAVSVTPKLERYAPGQTADLAIRTAIGGQGAQAAVGLFGVDESLGQIATLPGADAMARLAPKVETSDPAFGVLDGQALALGRIRGVNAAAATVLRVSAIPPPPALDAVASGRASTTFDPLVELTDNFYRVLAELHAQTRRWEASAPKEELMRPATMARLWGEALRAVEARQEPVTDAYGRKLTLRLLPEDLLALTDPRFVVVIGTRLPEDTDNWIDWVQKEKP